ncbi:MAG: hypothetical protein FD123_2777 [Bacteroidetes bacterium]|nr:MAG: hypothetical protein FD123_2777 [Bacteroidota bacterium]
MKKIKITSVLALSSVFGITGITLSAQNGTLGGAIVEAYSIFGGANGADASYWFMGVESSGGAVKILKGSQESAQKIDVIRENGKVFFQLNGTTKYLTWDQATNNVNLMDGRTDNATFREVSPLYSAAGAGWKSYRTWSDSTRYLRHSGFVLWADNSTSGRCNECFIKDATWSIEAGSLVAPPTTPVAIVEAYGRHRLQTYAVVNKATTNFFISRNKNVPNDLKLVDKNKLGNYAISTIEVRYRADIAPNACVLVDSASNQFYTPQNDYTVILKPEFSEAAVFYIENPNQGGVTDAGWFSLRSKFTPNNDAAHAYFLRHTGYKLYIHYNGQPGATAMQYFKKDATWNFGPKR